ncbi:phosphopantetheine-binding protein [Methylomagnum sp.]
MTSKEDIFRVVKGVIAEMLPDLDPVEIEAARSLSELGANSVDRTEVAVLSMEKLDISVPLVELAKVKNLEQLVEFLHGKLNP